ncbi:Replication protein O [Fictibacillus aquaticus]|uniref:Replication protein O n=1 Tax=Fictibacillus aquaticus TaxID=2021314 RepID=UPI001F0A212E|nr:Replication protein O [Fictibacillus aquaticus]
MQGFIKLQRKIQEHWIYQEKRKFSKYEAWLDILMMANHKDNKFVHGNDLVEVKKGSFITSELKLMERWDWGKAKLRSFLEMLEKDGMIVKESDRKKTTITICNYCIYHGFETESRPQADHEQTTSRPSADTNKNDKNEKNVNKKNKYAALVSLTEQEYQTLIQENGQVAADKMIQELDEYKEMSGRKYKSDYLAIKKWVKDKVLKEMKTPIYPKGAPNAKPDEQHPQESGHVRLFK